jgi:peroxiredoxin
MMTTKLRRASLALALSLMMASAAWAGTDTPLLTAAQFELKDLDGKAHLLSDYLQAGPVFLWFTNFCGGCQGAMPQLKAAFADTNAPLLIVSLLGDDRQTPARVVKKQEMTYPILLDPDGKITKLYSGTYISGTCPMENFYAVGQDGSIFYSGHYPGLDKEELDGLIAKWK